MQMLQEPIAATPSPKLTDAPDSIPEDHPARQGEDRVEETILELGAEGGSLTLLGKRDAAGKRQRRSFGLRTWPLPGHALLRAVDKAFG